jgi:hypothetical protein
MPLITKVLKPGELNAETMAKIYCDPVFLELSQSSQQDQIDRQQRVLAGLVQLGILGE